MHGNEAHFLTQIGGFLGWFYLALALMNAIAAFYCWEKLKRNGLAVVMLVICLFFVIISV